MIDLFSITINIIHIIITTVIQSTSANVVLVSLFTFIYILD